MYQSLRLLDMLVPEKELSIEIAEIDGVEIDNVNRSKAGKNKVFQ